MSTANKAAAQSPETKAARDDFLAAFEAFKEANDQRLEELERRGGADVLLEEKVARIDAALTEQKSALDRVALAGRRPGLEEAGDAKDSVRAQAFDAYARSGDASALIQTKSLSAGSEGDGGYVVPDETEAAIDRRLAEVSPIRAIATVRQVSAATFKKPVSLGGATAGWAAETGDRDGTDSPTLDLIEFPTSELYAMPAATQQLLDDSAVNIDEWLAEEVRDVFAAQESAAFVAGNGTGKPKGFLAYDTAADGTQDADEIGYLATGTAGDFDADDPLDKVIELIYAPKPAYRPNAAALARASLQDARAEMETLEIELPPSRMALEAGDALPVTLGGAQRTMRVRSAAGGPARRAELSALAEGPPLLAGGEPGADTVSARARQPELWVLDLPLLPGESERQGPLAAAFADPWPGAIQVWAGPDAASATPRASLRRPATMGELVWGLWPGAVGRWDYGNRFRVRLFGGSLSSQDRLAALAGGNMLAVEGPDGAWEILIARHVELVEPGVVELSGLLRGLSGTEGAMAAPVPPGARIVVLDAAAAPVPLQDFEAGAPLTFGAGAPDVQPADWRFATLEQSWTAATLRPLAPVHMRGRREAGGVRITWTRRSRIGGDAWGAAEIPLGEEAEAYELEILSGGEVALTLEAGTGEAFLALADEAAIFGGPVWQFDVCLYQLSARYGRGAPAAQTLYLTA